MATLTSYPNPSPEVTTVDGYTIENTAAAWATIRAAAGDLAGDSDASCSLSYIYWNGSNWGQFNRGFTLFDTSSLSTATSVDSATYALYVTGKSSTVTDSYSMVDTNPASNTAIVAGDYDSLVSATKQATDLTGAGITTSAYNTWTLNATGISNINTSGVSKFGVRNASDVDNSEPAHTTGWTGIDCVLADTSGTGSDPKLTITYTGSATDVFYPNPSVEDVSVDGRADDSGNNVTWTNLIAEPGNSAVDNTASGDYTYWLTSATTNQFATLERGFMLFDTSSIGDSNVVSTATLSMYGNSKSDPQSNSPTTNITSSAPASNTAIAAGDFDSVGSTAYATAITYAGYNTAGYNDYVFNASGIASIALSGVSKYSIRMGNDIDDSAPTWASSQWTGFGGIWADTAGVSSDPKLTVVHGDAAGAAAIIPISTLGLLGVG